MFCFRYYGQFHDYTSKDLELQSWAKELSEGVGKVEKQIHVIYNVSVKKVFSLTKNSIAIAIKTELGKNFFLQIHCRFVQVFKLQDVEIKDVMRHFFLWFFVVFLWNLNCDDARDTMFTKLSSPTGKI